MPERDVRVRNVYRGKNVQVLGAILFMLGLLSCAGALLSDDATSPAMNLGIAMVCIVGLSMYLVGKIQHWYHAE